MTAGQGTAIGGMFFKLIGMWMQAGQEDREDDLAAADAQQNAARARWAAGDARNRGQQEAARLTLEGGQLQQQQRLALASSGVVSTSGTAGQIQAQTAALTRLDAAQVQNNAMREAWGHEVVGKNYESEWAAAKDRKRARAQKTFLTTVGTVVGDLGGMMGGSSFDFSGGGGGGF